MTTEESIRDRLYRKSVQVTLAAPRAVLPAGCLAGGRYRLVEQVGAGGTAVVHRRGPSRLPRDLCEAIQQALAHEPDERQDSVAQFRAQLTGDGDSAFRRRRAPAMFPAAARDALPSAA